MITLLEGLDRCGKSAQIRKIQPLLVNKPLHVLHNMAIQGLDPEKVKEYSREMYFHMFQLLHSSYRKAHFLLDRSHIGEAVYSPIYRNYSGDYVFDIEEHYRFDTAFWDNICLITLIDKPENLIKRDDGLSFSTRENKKKEEIYAFVRATKLSMIPHKLIINIDGKSEDVVTEEIRNFLDSLRAAS